MANTHVEIFHNYGHTCKERDLICARCILNIDSEPIIDTLKNTVNDFTQRLWFIWRFGEISCDGRFWKQISLTFVTWFENTFFCRLLKTQLINTFQWLGKKLSKCIEISQTNIWTLSIKMFVFQNLTSTEPLFLFSINVPFVGQ